MSDYQKPSCSAIVGCGGIGAVHASALRAVGRPIGWCVDRTLERAAAFASEHGIPHATGEFEDVLADSRVDTVHLATPPAEHAAQARAALEAGKHVLCEKPLTTDPVEAAALRDLARATGCRLGINFDVRYRAAAVKARRLIAAGELGAVRLMSGSYKQEYHILPVPLAWRYDPAVAGPMRAVTEIGSHWIDLASHLTGARVTRVSAHFHRLFPERIVRDGTQYAPSDPAVAKRRAGDRLFEVASEDAATLVLFFDNGAVATCVLNEVAHGRGNEIAMDVTGERASLWFNTEEDRLYLGRKGRPVEVTADPFAPDFGGILTRLVRDFYAETETPTYPTAEDGVYNIAVCEAAFRSAAVEGAVTDVSSY